MFIYLYKILYLIYKIYYIFIYRTEGLDIFKMLK